MSEGGVLPDWFGGAGPVWLCFQLSQLEGARMSELVNVLPVLGAIIVLGAIALGSAVRPTPEPVRIKPPRR
jgi:hypothetical protein